MSINRARKDKGRSDPIKGSNGKPICRYCKTEVRAPRRTFCSDVCVHEWKIRTQPVYVRKCLLKRDDGICSRCGIDAIVLELELKIAKRKDPVAWMTWHRENGVSTTRRSMWDGHHINAVVEGGGECGLDGFQTLCILCHLVETKQLMSRIARRRKTT